MWIKRIVGVVLVYAVFYLIPLTARAVESLIRSAAMSFGSAQGMMDVNIGIAKLILAGSLILLVFVLTKKTKS